MTGPIASRPSLSQVVEALPFALATSGAMWCVGLAALAATFHLG